MGDKGETGGLSRRALLAGMAATPALTAAVAPAAAQAINCDATTEAAEARCRAALKDARGTKLVLLGTGAGPVPGRTRRMTSHVMLHDGAAYVVDCGLGVTNQFARTGIPFKSVRSIYITHHHPDHNIEYGPFLVIGWIQGMQPSNVHAFGPPPLTEMTRDYLRSAKVTIDFWAEDLKMNPLIGIDVHDLPTPGPVMRDDNVAVTSVLVEHPPVKPAYGYRFDFADRSIAFSGDTVPLEVVARMARGADVLVHEAMYLPALEKYIRAQIAKGRPVSFDAFMAHMNADHSPVEAVGRIAQEAGVKTLVLSYLTPAVDSITDATWRAPAAKHFKGEIVVGHDLTVV
ncbi:MAG: MBL fold metallo-hydrolase [Alphaproteobacteria bacterium]|nr:MBL fold metallo-hydrolase [Alphaproteobacteria bacterium]